MAMNSSNPVFKRVESEVNAEYIDGTSEVKTASFGGVMIKTGILFLIALISGALFVTLAISPNVDMMVLVPVVIVSPLVAFVCCLVGTLSIKSAPVASVLYSVFEGIFLGALCGILETVFEGIFLIAFVTLAAIFAVTLLMYSIKAIRVTKRFYRVMMIMMVSAFTVTISTLLMSLFAPNVITGLQTDYFIWIMIAVDAVMVIYGVMMLVVDFDRATALAEMNAPKKYEWQSALGLMVTLVWILIYILRLLVYIMAIVGRKK